jgi:hypothetical protein
MKLTKTEVNCTTGEVKVLELTEEELNQRKIDEAAALATQQQKIDAEAKKAALLDRLGITEDEAKLLLL